MTIRCFAGSLLALSTALLVGCNCPDYDLAPVQFTLKFNTDTLGASRGFRTAELRESYLVRYEDNNFLTLVDTVRAFSETLPRDGFQLYFPGPGFPPQLYLPSSYPNRYNTGYQTVQSFSLHVGSAIFRLNSFDLQQSKHGLYCPETHVDHYFATLNGQRIDARGG